MEEPPNENPEVRGTELNRKRKRENVPKEYNWQKNKTKRARVEGEEYKNYKGVVVEKKEWLDLNCRCKCKEKLNFGEKDEVYKSHRSLGSHDVQTCYINGCHILEDEILLKNGKMRRKYKRIVRLSNRTITVCQRYFNALHAIDRSRYRTKVLTPGKQILDGRGRHYQHPRIPDDVVTAIKAFLTSVPAEESHYSSKKKNKNKKYLSSNLSIKALHRQFLKENEHFEEKIANYYIFRKIFHRDFKYSFGMPRSDICTTCERLRAQLNCLKNPDPGFSKDEVKIKKKETEIEDHLEDCESFYDAIRLAKTLGDEYCCLCFDYEKNLPLPKTSISNEYFLRQLWAQNFGVHDIKTGKASMFLYSEHYALKGANEVLSCLQWYVENKVPPQAKYLYLFADNCGGQNKNKYVFGFLQYLADTRFDKVVLVFPEPGHSRMPIDKDHGKIEKRKLTFTKIESPSKYVDIILESQPSNPFEIVFVQAPFTDDLTSDGKPVIDVKDFSASMSSVLVLQCKGVRAVRHMVFTQDSAPLVNSTERFIGNGTRFQILKEDVNHFNLQEQIENAPLAFTDFLPIQKAKFDNVKFLLKHVTLSSSTIFYQTLFYVEEEVKKKATKSKQNAKQVVKNQKATKSKGRPKGNTKITKSQNSNPTDTNDSPSTSSDSEWTPRQFKMYF